MYNTTATAPKTAEDIALKHGVKCQAYQADITVPAQISAAINQVVQDFGKLDVVVANAGICSEHAGEEYTPEEFQEIMDVNVNGAFYTAQAAANIFKRQGFGNVVFTASVSALLVNTPQRQAAVGYLLSFAVHFTIGDPRLISTRGLNHSTMFPKPVSSNSPSHSQWNGLIFAGLTAFHRATSKPILWGMRRRLF